MYADPATAAGQGNRCDIAAPVVQTITGRVVFSGAGWYRPYYRETGLGRIIPRISPTHAPDGNTDYTISMMADAVVAGGFAERVGYTILAPSTVDMVLPPPAQCAAPSCDGLPLAFTDLDAIPAGETTQ